MQALRPASASGVSSLGRMREAARYPRHQSAHGGGGFAMAEFVLTAPLLLLLMFAVIDLGRAYYQWSALTKAVREVARYCSKNAGCQTGGLPSSQVAIFNQIVQATGIGAPPTPSLDHSIANHVRVSATYSYAWITPMPRLLGLGASRNLSATTAQRIIP